MSVFSDSRHNDSCLTVNYFVTSENDVVYEGLLLLQANNSMCNIYNHPNCGEILNIAIGNNSLDFNCLNVEIESVHALDVDA